MIFLSKDANVFKNYSRLFQKSFASLKKITHMISKHKHLIIRIYFSNLTPRSAFCPSSGIFPYVGVIVKKQKTRTTSEEIVRASRLSSEREFPRIIWFFPIRAGFLFSSVPKTHIRLPGVRLLSYSRIHILSKPVRPENPGRAKQE